MLGVHDEASYGRRFGGFLFLFLRGLDPAGGERGVHFRRPSWPEVLAWERDLLESRPGEEGAA